MESHYDYLGLEPFAPPDEVAAAVERLSRQAGAIANTNPARSQAIIERLRRIKYDLLTSEERRLAYNNTLLDAQQAAGNADDDLVSSPRTGAVPLPRPPRPEQPTATMVVPVTPRGFPAKPLVILAAVLLILLLGGGSFVLARGALGPAATPTATPTPKPTATPIPTATPAPTDTPRPVPTSTPRVIVVTATPADTPTPMPADTPTPEPQDTPTPEPQDTPTPAAASGVQTTTYTGTAFSIDYPAGWKVQSGEQNVSYGTDTTIVSPDNDDTLLRVDITPTQTGTDPQSAAQAEIDRISQEPGYQKLDLSPGTFDGYPAIHWEFLIREGGVLLHKEDEFFIDTDNSDGVAILTQAPAGDYGGLTDEFAGLRQSLSMN